MTDPREPAAPGSSDTPVPIGAAANSEAPAGSKAPAGGDTPAGSDTPDPAGAPQPSAPWPTRWIYLLLITVVMGLGDQASKQWAQDELQPVRQQRVLSGFVKFNLTYVRNPGAAWGFLARADESFRRPFFLIISCVAMAFILYLFLRLQRGQVLLMVALALVMSGAVGNFIDRIRYNYVVDFLDFRVGGFKWPTFNVADVAITVGVIFLFAEMFLLPWVRRRAQLKAASREGGSL